MDPTSSKSGSGGAPGDAALLRRIVERQPDSLAELYDRFSPALLALASRILGSAADAEDVLQEVFVHVWNHAQRYDPARSSVSTWLVLITRSRAIDRLRSRGVVERTHSAAGQEAARGADADTSPAALENVFIQQRHERVRRAMEDLPAEQRQVLEMAFYHGLSQSEIAAQAGVPLGTVKTRTLLAMRKLRNALREEIRQLL
jgi:RNA polymerase sigma-70 factor, ECF subfamily